MGKTLNKETGKAITGQRFSKAEPGPTKNGQIVCQSSCPKKKHQQMRRPYRVFISYSHDDKEMAAALKNHLKRLGLFPTMDHEIRVGESFSDEIRDMIECAHVFMPLVTKGANQKLWVQQEIGYASALHVPVCPIVMDAPSPAGMNEHIQAIVLEKKDDFIKSIEGRLTYETFDELVRGARKRDKAGRYDCAMHWVERQEILADLTEAAIRGGCKVMENRSPQIQYDESVWRLRQRARFTSFSIPNADFNSPVWDLRDRNRYKQQYDRQLLRRERQAIERYVNCFGCDIIMDIGTIRTDSPEKFKSVETAIRLRLCIDFLVRQLKSDRVRVVIPEYERKTVTLLFIIGDWFATEAVVPQSLGVYDRTMFTRHAPTVLNMIARFDQDFRDCLPRANPTEADFRAAKADALKLLRSLLQECEKDLDKRKEIIKVAKEMDLQS